jgi:hydroxymethylpyrimidine pyrophosphatase-like HAD family hydrolase
LACNVSLVANNGDALYANQNASHIVQVHEKWGEPHLVILDAHMMDHVICHGSCFHKIICMHHGTQRLVSHVRDQLEALAALHECVVTQAVPTMLELLPAGCFKAVRVSKLCKALEINMANGLCAIRDAEKDVKLLQVAAIGVAVANACPKAPWLADVIMKESYGQGGSCVLLLRKQVLLYFSTTSVWFCNLFALVKGIAAAEENNYLYFFVYTLLS